MDIVEAHLPLWLRFHLPDSLVRLHNKGGMMPDKKEGTTRLMFVAAPIILLVLGAVIVMYAVLCILNKDMIGLKELAVLSIGSLTTTLGAIVVYYFSTKSS